MAEPHEFNQLPSAAEWAGKKFLDSETGTIFQSDGKDWTPMERPQGPSIGQQMLRGAIPTAATAATFLIPGATLARGVQAAGRVIPALGKATPTMARTALEIGLGTAGEGVTQATGLAAPSGTDLATASLAPLIGRGVLGATKGAGRALGNVFVPQQMRRAGAELVEETFKGPSSKALFEIARRQGPVPTTQIISSIDNAIAKEAKNLTPSSAAIKILTNFRDKIMLPPTSETVSGQFSQFTRQVPGGMRPTLDYDELIDGLQRLRYMAESHFKRGNNVTGMALSRARSEILDEMDKISPAIKAANAAYRREANLDKLLDILAKNDPGGQLQKTIRHDDLFAKGFTKDEFQLMTDLVDRIGATPGSALGLGRVIVQAFAEPGRELIANPLGRAGLKQMLKEPGRGAQGAATFAQMIQEWQNRQKQP